MVEDIGLTNVPVEVHQRFDAGAEPNEQLLSELVSCFGGEVSTDELVCDTFENEVQEEGKKFPDVVYINGGPRIRLGFGNKRLEVHIEDRTKDLEILDGGERESPSPVSV